MLRRCVTLVLATGIGMSALFLACDENDTSPSMDPFDIPWQTVVRFDRSLHESFDQIWASSANDVFLARTLYNGNKIVDVRVSHFDGLEWKETGVPWKSGVGAIWGAGPSDVYLAVGTLDHFDGEKWNELPLTANGVTGTAADNVLIANSGALLHFDGADWDTLRTLDDEYPSTLVAASDGSVFLTAYNEVSIWNGTTWVKTFPGGNCVGKVCPFAIDDAFVRVSCGNSSDYHHWDGQEWSFQPLLDEVSVIGGISGSDAYGVGQIGTMFHYDGTSWERLPRVTLHSLGPLSATSSGVAVAGRDRKVLWLDDSGARVLHEADIDYTRFEIAAESSAHFMLSDGRSIYRYDEGKWSEAALPFWMGQARALGGRSMSDMYAGFGIDGSENGLVAHYDGTSWSQVDTMAVPANGFWVTPSGVAYSIGGGSVYRRGATWDGIKSGSQFMELVTGDGDNGIVTAARLDADPEHLLIAHFDGTSWSNLPTSVDFVYGMWAGPGMDLYLAQQSGLYHLCGNRYCPISGPGQQYDFVFGTPDGRVFALNERELGVFERGSFKRSPVRGPWEAFQAADGSIVAEVGDDLAIWAP